MTEPLSAFISYALEDYQLLKELEKHLALLHNQGFITTWSEQDISAGSAWETETETHLKNADIILLLISPDFMASKYSNSAEMQHIMNRHASGHSRVILVLLRAVDLEGAQFNRLRKLPDNGVPVISQKWPHLDEAFTNIAKGIRKVIEEIQSANNPNPLQEKLFFALQKEKLASNPLAELKKRLPEFSLQKTLPAEQLPASNPLSAPNALFVYNEHTNSIATIAWSPDGKYIASADQNGLIRIWEPATGKNKIAVSAWGIGPIVPSTKKSIQELLWSPDSQYLAAHIGSKDSSRAFIWHVETQKSVHFANYAYLPYSHTHCFAWSPDGLYIAMDDKFLHTKARIGLWSVDTKEHLLSYVKHTNEQITSLDWSPDKKVIASSDADGNIHIWDTSGQKNLIYAEHAPTTNVKVAWSPDGKYLASGGNKGEIQIWSSNLGKKVATYHAVGPVNWLKWLHEGAFLAFSNGSLNYHVNILNLKTRARHFSTAHKGLLSPDGKYFAAIYEHTSIQIQEIETGALFYTYRDHESRVLTFAWSPDSRSLASSDLAHTIHVWQIQARIFENG